jgi:hypothetical protein
MSNQSPYSREGENFWDGNCVFVHRSTEAWCSNCGTVSSDGECHCTDPDAICEPDWHPIDKDLIADLAAKGARIAALESALSEAGEALEPFANTAKQLDEAGPYAQIADDDDVLCGGFKLSLPMRYLRKAKDVREKIKALCHASPEQADGSVSPDKPALHPGDGETR